MKIQLSDHFTLHRLIRFVLPSIGMMIFTSIYGVVDGLFVSNYAGKTPFAAVNLIMPLLMVLGALGFMMGTGGSAIIAKTMGEGKSEKANRYFSLVVYTTAVSGIVLAVLGQLFIRPAAVLLGADKDMIGYCVDYGRIIIAAVPFFMLQNVFQSLLITAEKPKLGLIMTVAAGMTNIIGDFLFVGVINGGVKGAAYATALSQLVGGAAPLIYFLKRNAAPLRLGKTSFEPKVLLKVCTNGSSEMMSNISASLVGMLYNFQLMRFAGKNGVAAYGVMMYAGFIFAAIFIGYSIGTAPVISYNYGSGNDGELKNLFKKSLGFNALCGIAMVVLSFLAAPTIAKIFVGYDEELMRLTVNGFRIYSFSFLFCGFNIFGSGLFTALNNGLVSALISFLRTLVFQVAAVLVLPEILKIDGVWLAVIAAEFMAIIVTTSFTILMRKRYRYI